MNTTAFLHDEIRIIKEDQKNILVALSGIKIRLTQHETEKTFYANEINTIKNGIADLKETIKEMNDKTTIENKENQKYKNYAAAGWIILGSVFGTAISFFIKLFPSKP